MEWYTYRSEFYSMYILGIMIQNIPQWIWSKQTKENIAVHCRHGQRLQRALLSAALLDPATSLPCKTCLVTTNINTTPLAFVGWGLKEAHPCVVMFPVETWAGECVQACLPFTTCCPPDQELPDHFIKYSPGETPSLYHKPHWKGNIHFLNECLAGGIKSTFKYFLK